MKTTTILSFALSIVLLAANAFAQAEWDWTSQTPENRDVKWRLYYGTIFSIDGSVDETFRAFYAATGQDYKQSLAESYDLGDFNVKGPYYTLGFHYDCSWRYWAFKWDTLFFNISADSKAKRDYYIGLGDDISYGGRSYDHLMVAKGDDFSIDLFGMMSDLMFSYSPITFFYGENEDQMFAPSLDLGLVLFGGRFKVDDGSPRGTTVYQNPPVDFVIGGNSSMFIGGGAPKIGLGGTYWSGREGEFQWVSHLDIGFFMYDGSTKPFTGNSHREKELDVSMFSINAETGIILPIDDALALTAGVRLQFLNLSGDIKSKEKDTEKIIAARERFDKSVDFRMATIMLYLGLTY